ncbi:MAG: hypothetical protein WA919_18010 [Coleofasciculaceae cyanobacterium]
MKTRPSNTIIKAFLGILVVLGLYIIGGLLIKVRREANESPEVGSIDLNDQYQKDVFAKGKNYV